MITPDVNMLLYATVDAFPDHPRAHAWWEGLLSGETQVGIPTVCALGFMRLATNRRIFTAPMSISSAATVVRSWTAQPHVRRLEEGVDHLDRVLDLLESTGAAGDLTTDAQIAALSLRHDAIVATNDTNFRRFPAVRTVNPLAR